MPNILRRAAMAATAAVACAITFGVPAAHAATTVYHSKTWAGYYAATGNKTVYGVGAEWAVPGASCADSRGGAPFLASTWVGIGGWNDGWPGGSNSLLEQDGIDVYCATSHSQPVYKPFWEIAPNMSSQHWAADPSGKVKGDAQVKAGDLISAWVAAPDGSPKPGEWYFEVDDFTSGKSWGEYYKLPASDNKYTFKTVEAITEWSEGYHCAATTCRKTASNRDGFAYLGQVNYTDAYWQTSGGNLLPIAKSRISMYPDVARIAAVTATNPTTSEGSDVTGDAFSTNYTRYWYTDF